MYQHLPQSVKTIHYLSTGHASCGLEGLPQDWPEDHLWAGEWEHVTCQGCLSTKPIQANDLLVDLSKPLPKEKPRQSNEARKEPCYTDTDTMPFGKYKNEQLSDVPAGYFHWLWQQRPISDKYLENYIYNNIDALRKEHPDGIWT